MHSNSGMTAVVHTCASRNLGERGSIKFSMDWGDDHLNSFEATADEYTNIDHAELHAAHQAIKRAARQKYSRIIIRSGSHFVNDWIRNSANFAKSPNEVLKLVQSIHCYKNQIIVNVEFVDEE